LKALSPQRTGQRNEAVTRSNVVVIGEVIANAAHSEIMPSEKLRLKCCQQSISLIEL
jgi:hypothetical protein